MDPILGVSMTLTTAAAAVVAYLCTLSGMSGREDTLGRAALAAFSVCFAFSLVRAIQLRADGAPPECRDGASTPTTNQVEWRSGVVTEPPRKKR